MCLTFKKPVLIILFIFLIIPLLHSANELQEVTINHTNEKEIVSFSFSGSAEPIIEEGRTVLGIIFPETIYPEQTNIFYGNFLADRVFVYSPKEDMVKAEIVMGHKQFEYETSWDNTSYMVTLTPEKEEVIAEEPDISTELEKLLLENRISLDIKEASIVNILRLISAKTGVNIIAGPEVTGTVSVRFQDVPLKGALDSILRARGFGYVEENGILRVTTIDRLGISRIETQTRIYHLNWTFAREVSESIRPLLTSDVGQMSVNASTNNLIITDTPHRLAELEKFIQTIDKRTRQVLIEARMANVDKNYSRDIGLNWSLVKNRLTTDTALVFPFDAGQEGSFFQLGTTIGGHDLNMTLDALEREGHVDTLESPRIIVTDNMQAEFEVIGELPYTEAKIESGGISQDVRFKDVGVRLFVTPHITDTNDIMMDIETEQIIEVGREAVQTAGGGRTVTNFVPIVDRRSTKTNLIVHNNTPFVIGGFRSMKQDTAQRGTPGLRSIPLLGALFRSQVDSTREVELMVFVTPSIYDDRPLDWHERVYYERFDHF